MRAIVQRVSEAQVSVEHEVVGAIGPGVVVLLGVKVGDTPDAARYVADKVAGLRIFADADGRMNRSLLDTRGQALIVSQFTLYGDTRSGRRPSYTAAARPEDARPLYELVVAEFHVRGVDVATGRFGALMQVRLTNDGPVTLLVESN